MSELTHEELILLDNLIYLQLDAVENEELMKIVERLIISGKFEEMDVCSIKMSAEEWKKILLQISSKPRLMELRITHIDNKYTRSMRAACFVDKQNNATVVFRGTVTEGEWKDNGQGAYEHDTKEQIEALDYINNLEFKDVIVTGHSKGGNKAQYVTILSDKVSKCISINGQGFSNEFITKYINEINKNKSKIICINSKYDYVYCLFNQIGGEFHYIETDFKINPLDYHRANVLLDKSGKLNKETNQAIIQQEINRFSISFISFLPKDIQSLIINAAINSIELVLCNGQDKDRILKAAREFLIMSCYEDYNKNDNNYNICVQVFEVYISPLLFWEELINVEETNSKEFLDKFLSNLNLLTKGVIKNIDIIGKDQKKLIDNILNQITNLSFKLKNKMLE
ncbi:Mbeg1-like protein [Clostridium sp. C2-6-12]|uniref:Mbeg1-like protein n=1 Tax=Clostridium sp. C2-6-12 TaxID=2698832 RepID=UPI00136ED2DE|nr:Mbeg1-like protein [Clostridium sp. C2-6-12]